jgi:hypothetical protein
MDRPAEVVLSEIDVLLDELSAGLGTERDWAVPAAVEAAQLALRVRSRAEGAAAALVGVVDRLGGHGMEGFGSLSAWLTSAASTSRAEARRMAALARGLQGAPLATAAVLAGRVGPVHARLLGRARRHAPELFTRDEAVLVDEAGRLRCEAFGRAVRYWMWLADQEQTEDEAEAMHRGRRLDMSRTFRDTWVLDATFDPVGGEIVAGELERIERELFEADWAAARDQLGREPVATDLGRTAGQRRADALVEMAARSASLPEGAARCRPLITVVIDHPRFAQLCQTAGGAVLTTGQVIPLLTEADVERVVFGPAGRAIDVGARRRLFTGATRRVVEVRDLFCADPSGCDVPYPQCQVDHIEPWAAGGDTVQANGRLLCPFHNRNRPRARRPEAADGRAPPSIRAG